MPRIMNQHIPHAPRVVGSWLRGKYSPKVANKRVALKLLHYIWRRFVVLFIINEKRVSFQRARETVSYRSEFARFLRLFFFRYRMDYCRKGERRKREKDRKRYVDVRCFFALCVSLDGERYIRMRTLEGRSVAMKRPRVNLTIRFRDFTLSNRPGTPGVPRGALGRPRKYFAGASPDRQWDRKSVV